jgi:DNA-binding beta-propeller fold protein YncE
VRRRLADFVLASMLLMVGTPAAFSAAAGASAPSAAATSGLSHVGQPPVFKEPFGLAVAGGDLFVSNFGDNSVTELDAASGRIVRVLSAPDDRFDGPTALAVAGGDLFVASSLSRSITVLQASTGRLVRILSGLPAEFSPYEMGVAGGDLVVSNIAGSIVELDASSGKLVRTLRHHGHLGSAWALAATGGDVFVANVYNKSVSELDAANGRIVRVLSAPDDRFDFPGSLAVAAGELFVANIGGNTVTELDAANGALVRVVPLAKVVGGLATFSQSGPWTMAVTGGKLFVLDFDGKSVTEFDATNGHLVQVIH